MSRIPDPDLQHYLRTAESIAQEARTLILADDPRNLATETKPDGSPVTAMDLAVEDLIRSRIRAAYPTHAILGEERPETTTDSPFQWIVDPIDGTRSFGRRIPLYGTLLALRHEGRPVVGVIALPGLDLLYAGATGLSARCNGELVRIQTDEPLVPMDQEIIATGDRHQFVSCGQEAVFDHLMRSEAYVRTYSDCFGHALAIDGRIGAMVDYDVSIWDMAATEVLVQEAGGRFVCVGSSPAGEGKGPRYNVVFGKSNVVAWVLDRIQEADA
ncbi:MAG: histidinol phosphate phosphatase [bacterium]|nr:histidinol phosphate phosphatase [bacterium]